MPKLAADLYATHYQDGVLRMAARPVGVSRRQIMESLNISRAIADALIKRCNLRLDRKEGRTEYFVLPGDSSSGATPHAPDEVEEAPLLADDNVLPTGADDAVVVEPNALADVVETDDQVIATLDEEIADTRNALKDAATKAGKAMGEWATNQALVDALRERLQELAGKRLALSS